MEKKLDKSKMRAALEAAMRGVEVPDLPPLIVCGVPFNQQTWTQKMLSEKDAAEAKAKLEAAAASEIAKEAAALEKQNESILREISTLQKKLAANKKIIDSKNAEVRRRRRSEAEAQLRRRMNK